MIEKDKSSFPFKDPYSAQFSYGLTQRDYLAAMAMQGITSTLVPTKGYSDDQVNWVAEAAYTIADAMIERSKV